MSSSPPLPPRILVVCTGNVCRSPLIERLLQRALDRRYGDGAVAVESAGTHALVGHAMDERSAKVLADLGGDSDGFVARRLVEPMIAQADLVLTATREHRGDVARMHPSALRRAFTFAEFASIVNGIDEADLPQTDDPAERIAQVTRLATAHRGLNRPATPDAFDLADPYRRPDEEYVKLQVAVAVALPSVLRALDVT